jgi:hypothetical protein
VREKGRLRARGSDEPASGYSYQDESHVETLRGGRMSTPHGVSQPSAPENDVVPQPSARASVAKGTMMGGFGMPSMSDPSLSREQPDSWPAMPSVPPELEGAADTGARERAAEADEALENMPTDPPKSAQLGGAIWQAVPSVMQSGEPPAHDEAPARARQDISALVQESAERMGSAPLDRFSESMRARISTHEAQYGDVRLAKLDPLIERSAWEQVSRELASERDVTPVVGLLRVIAQRELLPDKDKRAPQLTREAIQMLSAILEVPESSPMALLLAKRLLRRNRAVTAVAPSKGLSAGVLLAGLAAGVGVGWLITRIFL